MTSYGHNNFAIDQMVDKYVSKNFESCVKTVILKLSKEEKENYSDEIRNEAIEKVFDKKEELKLLLKRKSARKSKKSTNENATNKFRSCSLLKQALLTSQLEIIDKYQLL